MTYKFNMQDFKNITYPHFLYQFHSLWKKTLCKSGFHLFDEVWGTGWDLGQHYLYCDACDMTVIIDDDKTHTHEYQLDKMTIDREEKVNFKGIN